MPIDHPDSCLDAKLGSSPPSVPRTVLPETQDQQNSPTAKLKAFLGSGRYRPPEEMNDYSDDFRLFVPLDGVETADMRHQRERLRDSGHSEPEAAAARDAGPDGIALPAAYAASDECAKPWVSLRADRCPHRHARREGCRRCIEACPNAAIGADDEIPHIDRSRCDECAACVAACPSGALNMPSSPTQDLLQRLRSKLALHADPGRPPILVYHDLRTEPAEVELYPGKSIAGLGVRSLGLIGMESLLSAMAMGASGVFVLVDDDIDERMRRRLDQEVQWSLAVLAGLGFPTDCMRVLNFAQLPEAVSDAPGARAVPPARYAFDQPKPRLIGLAAEHLARHGANPDITSVPLPDGAPFGAVRIDASTCTLCMACAGACKMKALIPLTGQTPGLQFTEMDCVQCGLCAQVCPENALRVIPRLNWNPGAAAAVKLHQVEPAGCLSCGRPFAAHQMIAAIQRKLRGHWMYASDEAQNRLHMCDRCRVQEIFLSSPGKGTYLP